MRMARLLTEEQSVCSHYSYHNQGELQRWHGMYLRQPGMWPVFLQRGSDPVDDYVVIAICGAHPIDSRLQPTPNVMYSDSMSPMVLET